MAEHPITFHSQHPTFRMRDSGLTKRWLTECAAGHSAKIQGVHYLFCSDEHMLNANRQFLGHDYYTDILTRLLQAENAERIRGEKEERESRTAQDVQRDAPPSLEEYERRKSQEIELLRTVPADLNPYYKEKVNDYFNTLGAPERE